MEIKDFKDEHLQSDFIQHIKAKRLIPLIGSGFTRHCIAKNGRVPSGADMKTDMITELENVFPSTIDKLKQMKFSQVASRYEKHVEKSVKHKYIEDFFINVQISDIKKDFLNIDWPYVYTINIDDGIENNSRYEVVLPCEELNQKYLEEKKCLFKLHGDAHDVLKYRNSDKYIFSEAQYISSLKNNRYLLDLLRNDIISNNILYIGCSLEDEIDILSEAYEAQVCSNKMKVSYYVTKTRPDDIEISQLEDFGVDVVVLVDNYDDFYMQLYSIFIDSQKIEKEILDDYLNPHITLASNDYNNIDYLFDSNIIYKELNKKVLKLPYFYFDRDIIKEMLSFIDKKDIQIIYGHRLSGKTYCLLSLLRHVSDRNVYYFPSMVSLNNSSLCEILNKERALILFDSNTLDEAQIRLIIDNISNIKKNNLKIIFAVNSSDKELINTITTLDKDAFEDHYLENKLTETECGILNKKLSQIDIPIFDRNKSILDNIFIIDEITYSKNRVFTAPKLLSLLKEELVALIILATKETLSSFDIVKFDLSKEIGLFHEKVEPAIQYEYTSRLERINHSGYKIIPNAKYWILKTLGNYSKLKVNQPHIVEAYKYISFSIKQSCDSDYEFSKEISKYIKFDIINDIFPRYEKGSVTLINSIYEGLHDILSTDPQYFHQRAKSKLWLNHDDINELSEALKYARKSKHDIEVSKDINNKYVKSSLSHIAFTIALIYGRISNLVSYRDAKILEDTIDSYYEALTDTSNFAYVKNLLNKTKKFPHKDTADLTRLIENVGSNVDIKRRLSNQHLEKIQYIFKMLRS